MCYCLLWSTKWDIGWNVSDQQPLSHSLSLYWEVPVLTSLKISPLVVHWGIQVLQICNHIMVNKWWIVTFLCTTSLTMVSYMMIVFVCHNIRLIQLLYIQFNSHLSNHLFKVFVIRSQFLTQLWHVLTCHRIPKGRCQPDSLYVWLKSLTKALTVNHTAILENMFSFLKLSGVLLHLLGLVRMLVLTSETT